jgi:hypothetical protein
MTQFVRVKDPVSGHEYSTSADFAESAGLQVLKKDAVDDFGRALPAKINISTGAKPAEKESA